jgi:hypothetical protein
VGHDPTGGEVLRFDAIRGHPTARIHFSARQAVDSIAFGYGAVWVLSSKRATLYKIDPRSARVIGRLVVAHSRATRPEVMLRFPDIFVRVMGGGGMTYPILPSPLGFDAGFPPEQDGPPSWEENEGWQGSLWWYHQPDGVVMRQETAGGPMNHIQVTRSVPRQGGPCITSMTVASASLWVTVAPSRHHTCSR